MPTRVIPALVGPKGSAKSSVLRWVGKLLFGSNFDVTSIPKDEKDFEAVITNDHFVALDNADEPIRWLPDKLAVAATGGIVKRRSYYTTNTMVSFPITAYVAITSRTPHFRRDDVAERLLLFDVNRLDNFTSQSGLDSKILSSRNEIMTEVLHMLHQAVRHLAAQRDVQHSTSFRMADFASFCLKACGRERAEPMRSVLDGMTEQQGRFALDGDPLYEVLLLWLKDSKNVGRRVSTAELASQLAELATVHVVQFPHKTAKSLGARLNNLMPTLRHFLDIEEHPLGQHRREISFRPKEGKVQWDEVSSAPSNVQAAFRQLNGTGARA